MDTRIEAIADSYIRLARGNPSAALRSVIADALADLCEAERRTACRDRLISYGYVRGADDEGQPLRLLTESIG